MKRQTLTEERCRKYYKLTEYQAAEAMRLLPAVKKALKANKIYATVHTVSKSGMSRTISLYMVNKGEIVCLDWAFGKIFGDSITKDHEVRINGCGMDMLFEANYRLFLACCPGAEYQAYCRYKRL
jgi:hypothetical protein